MRAVCPLGWSRSLRVSPLSGERDVCPPCLSVTSRALLSEREMSPPEEPLGREKVQVTDSRFSREGRTGTQGAVSRAWRKGRDAGHTGTGVGLSLQDVGLQGAAPHHLARTFSSCIVGSCYQPPPPAPPRPGLRLHPGPSLIPPQKPIWPRRVTSRLGLSRVLPKGCCLSLALVTRTSGGLCSVSSPLRDWSPAPYPVLRRLPWDGPPPFLWQLGTSGLDF